MVGNIRILLTSCCVVLLLAGCQSEAEFSAVCGNGVRESGEACDGEDLDPSRDRCDENGAGTGVVHCHSDCTLDLSMCTGSFDCDPLNNTGCDGGKVCYYDPNEDEVDCSNPGAKGIGAPCGHSPECQAKLVCVNSMCQAMCDTKAPQCPSPQSCVGGWSMDWGFCEVLLDCDPVGQTGCSFPSACYVQDVSGTLGCLMSGEAILGQACSSSANCEPGLQCTSLTGGTCLQLCWETADCDSGTCVPYETWAIDLGFCY